MQWMRVFGGRNGGLSRPYTYAPTYNAGAFKWCFGREKHRVFTEVGKPAAILGGQTGLDTYRYNGVYIDPKGKFEGLIWHTMFILMR